MQMRHTVANFATYASGAILWPNLYLVQVVPGGHKHIAVLYFFVSGMGNINTEIQINTETQKHRNTNINDKDHLVGQLTRWPCK